MIRPGSLATFNPGPGLFGSVDRDGQTCRVIGPDAGNPGSVIVRWHADRAVSIVLALDLAAAPDAPTFAWEDLRR